jgi:tryptophan synthase beta chain
VVEAQAITQTDAFKAAVRFGRTEGILPAPEPSHAIKVAIDEALAAKEASEERVILFNLCGHGYLDMAAYDQFHRGELEDLEFSEEDMQKALDRLPQAPALA